MLQPTDPRDAALIEIAASVVGALILASARVDHAEIAAQVGRLLNAIVVFNAAHTERASDAPLRRALERL